MRPPWWPTALGPLACVRCAAQGPLAAVLAGGAVRIAPADMCPLDMFGWGRTGLGRTGWGTSVGGRSVADMCPTDSHCLERLGPVAGKTGAVGKTGVAGSPDPVADRIALVDRVALDILHFRPEHRQADPWCLHAIAAAALGATMRADWAMRRACLERLDHATVAAACFSFAG
jgi:hypothetical protein